MEADNAAFIISDIQFYSSAAIIGSKILSLALWASPSNLGTLKECNWKISFNSFRSSSVPIVPESPIILSYYFINAS